MNYSGFADEAGATIDEQIAATKALGWKHIELRNVGGKNATDISDAEFDSVCEKLARANISISCLGSAIANGRKVSPGTDEFEAAISQLTLAIPRMKKLNVSLIRGMSFRLPEGEGNFFGSTYEKKVIDTLRRMSDLLGEHGMQYGHENCNGYGNLSFEHTLKLCDAIPSRAFTLIYDTGNPVGSDDVRGNPPYRSQSSWEFYRAVRERVTYIHIKDARMTPDAAGALKKIHCYPGDGDGDVSKILTDLATRGYDGIYSMEMHVKPEQYTGAAHIPDAPVRMNLYVEYGQRFMKLLKEVQSKHAGAKLQQV